jgi:integrase
LLIREVAEMRRDEVDFESRVWRLPKERSKNRQSHAIPLSATALIILTKVPQIQSQGNFVFTSTGDRPIRNFTPSKNKLDSRMPNVSHWTFHDLRRTCASGLARLGILPHVIEACLNHRSGVISGIAETYNRHSYEPEKRGALDAWARHVDAIVSGAPAANVVELATARA